MTRVLIVDDALTVRMYHRQLMEQLGFEVDEASNGIEALEKGLSTRYELFIVDVNMPKMDGYRLVQEMRKNGALQHIPVIMVSTEAQLRDREQALLAGANFYVVKPADPDSLQLQARLLAGEV
ncbi:response regulator [Ectothiorhodospiraceae bacterium BW-2]|nr:response regulator [Ectothiorhodospiraceae bacterium BW-2]